MTGSELTSVAQHNLSVDRFEIEPLVLILPRSLDASCPPSCAPGVCAVPTLYKPQLTESATPMLDIWGRLYDALIPNARPILAAFDYYDRYDVPMPDQDSELSAEEKEGLAGVAKLRP
jgi:hypothetical protein